MSTHSVCFYVEIWKIIPKWASQLMRLWYLSHRRPAKATGEPAHSHSLNRAFAVRTHEVWKKTKGPTKNQTFSLTGWLAHARLKNEFTEVEKFHNPMTYLKLSSNNLPIYFSVAVEQIRRVLVIIKG